MTRESRSGWPRALIYQEPFTTSGSLPHAHCMTLTGMGLSNVKNKRRILCREVLVRIYLMYCKKNQINKKNKKVEIDKQQQH